MTTMLILTRLFDFCGHRYADEHCSSLGGALVVPRNEIENLEVVDIAEDYYKVSDTHFVLKSDTTICDNFKCQYHHNHHHKW